MVSRNHVVEMLIDVVVLISYLLLAYLGLTLAVGIVAPLINFEQGLGCIRSDWVNPVTVCFKMEVPLLEYIRQTLLYTPASSWLGLGVVFFALQVANQVAKQIDARMRVMWTDSRIDRRL